MVAFDLNGIGANVTLFPVREIILNKMPILYCTYI